MPTVKAKNTCALSFGDFRMLTAINAFVIQVTTAVSAATQDTNNQNSFSH